MEIKLSMYSKKIKKHLNNKAVLWLLKLLQKRFNLHFNFISMKKQIFAFAATAMIIGSVVTGCSSEKATNGSDSTATDSTATMTKPAGTDTTKASDTMKTDTMKKDTTKKPM